MARVKTGVLISGRGSNLQALIDATRATDHPAEIVLVISNVPGAAGLTRASEAGIPTTIVDHRDYGSPGARAAFEAVLTAAFEEAAVELVCLAGFMRVLTGAFVARWRDRLINIHPSLLPSFPGLDTHERALAEGVKLHGCTVHFVREAVDHGPIIGQAEVPVLPQDDAESLAARVLGAEHRLYPACLRLVAEGRARVVGEGVEIEAAAGDEPVLISPSL
ncbi:MAG: phosphoribosylglycinamide formyltransferase [Kiloniellales bacterium]|jgi:phosphoribosylglycinamide formyltransferase-1